MIDFQTLVLFFGIIGHSHSLQVACPLTALGARGESQALHPCLHSLKAWLFPSDHADPFPKVIQMCVCLAVYILETLDELFKSEIYLVDIFFV